MDINVNLTIALEVSTREAVGKLASSLQGLAIPRIEPAAIPTTASASTVPAKTKAFRKKLEEMANKGAAELTASEAQEVGEAEPAPSVAQSTEAPTEDTQLDTLPTLEQLTEEMGAVRTKLCAAGADRKAVNSEFRNLAQAIGGEKPSELPAEQRGLFISEIKTLVYNSEKGEITKVVPI